MKRLVWKTTKLIKNCSSIGIMEIFGKKWLCSKEEDLKFLIVKPWEVSFGLNESFLIAEFPFQTLYSLLMRRILWFMNERRVAHTLIRRILVTVKQMQFIIAETSLGFQIRREGKKVSKFQKQIFLSSVEPKTERNYFLISDLRI